MPGQPADRGTRPVLVANVAGSSADRLDGMLSMLRGETIVDVVTGDWLAEVTLATLVLNPAIGYETSFLGSFELALSEYLTYANEDLKVIVNAGALEPQKLAFEVQKLLDVNHSGKTVAYVTGDNVLDTLHEIDVKPLTTGTEDFSTWKGKHKKIICANAYIGSWGIVEALNEGADLVICGRVTDASPTIGAAAWWHGWKRDSFDELAGSLVAGHLIECGCYVTGGNFCGFTEIPFSECHDLSFPIAEIWRDGSTIIQKQSDQNGIVTIDTVKSQLLYEIQGIYYLNPDVIGDLSNVQCDQVAPNRIRVLGTKGLPAPETLKVAILSLGGYQAELSVYAAGLDIPKKVENFRFQTGRILDKNRFQSLEIQVYGTPKENCKSQCEAMVQIRVFGQAADAKTLSTKEFLRPILSNQLQSFPGLTQNFDFRTAAPKPYSTYFPGLIPLSATRQHAHFLHKTSSHGKIEERVVEVANVTVITKSIDIPRPVDLSPTEPFTMDHFGETVMRPLGTIVYARSGDKGPNVNVGFYCRTGKQTSTKWQWLRSFLSTEKLRELLGDENDPGMHIERCEFQSIQAVHFVLHDLLGAGVSSTSKMDCLGKNVAEYLRARHVEIPVRLLEK